MRSCHHTHEYCRYGKPHDNSRQFIAEICPDIIITSPECTFLISAKVLVARIYDCISHLKQGNKGGIVCDICTFSAEIHSYSLNTIQVF